VLDFCDQIVFFSTFMGVNAVNVLRVNSAAMLDLFPLYTLLDISLFF
jgi:hypothetical protein